jgi:hypothetical protein
VSVPIYRFDDEAPEVVQAFRHRHGRDWILYVDPLLGTARYVEPLDGFSLITVPEGAAGLDRAATAAAAVDFIDANRDLFGAGAGELTAPQFQSLGGGLLLVFGQRTRSGVAVRGAALRLQVGADGNLRFAKSFLGRGLSEAWEATGFADTPFLSAQDAAALALSEGRELIDARLELAFDGGRLDALIPLWRIYLGREAPGLVEELRDARSGELVESCELVKHFDVQGESRGVAAPLEDIFSPPQAILEEVRQPVEGVLVTLPRERVENRDLPSRPVALTAQDGSFCGTLPAGAPDTVTLYGSLATVFVLEDLNPCEGERSLGNCLALTVQPGSDISVCLENDDGVGDCIVDESQTQGARQPFRFVFNDGARRTSRSAVYQSFWLQCFVHARRVLKWSDDRIRDAFDLLPEAERPARLTPLTLQPFDSGRAESPRYLPGRVNQPAIITAPILNFVDLTWRGENGGAPEPFPMMPTTTAHEVAHHVLWELSRIGSTNQVEEGLVDALAALANDDPRMHWISSTELGPAGYSLDVLPVGGEPNRNISEVRAAVANGFWALRTNLDRDRRNPFHAARLLIRWAALNRADDPNARAYHDPAVLLADLIAVNRELIAEFGARHQVDEVLLRQSFRHCHFLGGVPFVRGDSNLDGRVDITDAIVTLLYLFGGSPQPHDCRDAMDANDAADASGIRALDLTDAIRVLGFLFLGGVPPSAPFPDCGLDSTRTDPYCCAEFVCPP